MATLGRWKVNQSLARNVLNCNCVCVIVKVHDNTELREAFLTASVRVPGYRPRGPGSINEATRFSE
jgi:hypothetical protein